MLSDHYVWLTLTCFKFFSLFPIIMDFGIYSLYSNLIDTKVKFCSLCFKIVSEDAVCLQDNVILGSEEDDTECSKSEEVDIHLILQEVLGTEAASYLSENDVICEKCTRSAINSYKFINMCKQNIESMATAVDLFTSTISDPNAEYKDHKTLFLSMNFHDSTCIQYFDTIKFKNNKSALTRFQYLFRPFKVVTDSEGNNKYQCMKCPAFYPKANTARRHFSSKHIEDQEVKKEVQNIVHDVTSPTKVDKNYIKHNNEKTHTVIKDSDGTTKYKCKKCPTVCTKAANARRHYQVTHLEDLQKTTDKRLKTREISKDYVRHLNEISYVTITDSDGTTKYQCTECGKVCSNTWNARRHFETMHMEKDLTISIKQNVESETKQHKRPVCIVCNENFENKYVLVKHILQQHSIEMVNDFTSIKADKEIYKFVYTVVKVENECQKYRCKVCGKICKNYTTVTAHFNKIHLRVTETDHGFICSLCGKECGSQFALKRHEERHTLRMTCPTCNKVYKSKPCFKQHVCFRETARSYMQKDFICDHCGKSFVSKLTLRLHIRYQHDPDSQRFKCQHCPKAFGAYCHWKAHQVKHTKERNFTCDICGNIFVTQMALVYHKRIHTGERPFECKFCDMKFLNSSRRADHVKRHHIAAMATCEICGVNVKAVGMKKHKRRHYNANSTLYISKEGASAKKSRVSKSSAKKSSSLLRYEYSGSE